MSSQYDDVFPNGPLSRRHFLTLSGASLAALGGGLTFLDEAQAASLGSALLAGSGTLNVALSNEPANLDPHQASAAIDALVMNDCYETLLVTLANGHLAPSLATHWTVSKNGKQITFHLKSGVKFHDGAAFNASVMKQSFDRMVNPATKSGLAASLLGPYAGSKVIDAHTLRMDFKQPYAPLLYNLTQPFTAPVSPKAIAKYGLGVSTHPVGTGPFTFKEWVKQDHISFTRYSGYKWAPNFYHRKGLAASQNLTFKIVPEDATRMATLRTGEADIVESFPPPFVKQFKANSKYAVDIEPRFGLPFCFMVNTQKAPLNDLRVRQALLYGTDKKAIGTAINFGVYPPAWGPLSPVTFGYWPGVEQMYHFNPAKARSLLDSAGWKVGSNGIRTKNGQPLSLEFWTLSDVVLFGTIGVAFQGQMKNIGVDVKIVSLARSAWGAGVFAGKHHLTIQSFALPDPSVLSINFHSKNIGGNGFNWSRYTNHNLDRALDAGDATFNRKQRKVYYQEAQKIIMDAAIVLPIYVNVQVFGHLAAVHGIDYIGGGYPLLYPTSVS